MAGQAAVSSLLRAATSQRNKTLQLNDDLAAYKFNNSEQNIDDYNEYKEYLTKRLGSTSDPSKQLTIQNKLDSARSAYTSNEIQRTAIGILEGTSTLQDKQSTVLQLYKDAVSNGDLNLAQNLRQTYDSIDAEIQRKAEADAKKMQGYAEEMSKAQVTSLTDLADSYLTGDNPDSPNLSNKQMADYFQKYGSDFYNDTGQVNDTQYNMWDGVYVNTTKAINALTEAANAAYAVGNDSKGDSLYEKALKLNNGESAIKFGNMSLTLDEVNNARDAARNGQNYFQARKDQNGNNILVKNKNTNYVWARDVNGNLRIVQTFDEIGNDFNKKQKDAQGKDIPNSSIADKLKLAGYDVEGTDGSGLLRVRATNSTLNPLADQNSSLGESFLVALDADGNARFVTEKGDGTGQSIMKINLTDPNAPDFGAVQEINGNDETFFGNKDINSVASDSGVSYINRVLKPLQDQVINSGDVTDLQVGGPLDQFYKGNQVQAVIQGAAVKKDELADRLAAASAAVVPQVVNIQGTGAGGANINNLQVPGGARLTVQPVVAPKVVVAPTPAAPKLSVAPVKSTGTLQVGNNNGAIPGNKSNSSAPTSTPKLKVL